MRLVTLGITKNTTVNSWGYSKQIVNALTESHHDDVIEWKHFPRYWPFVGGIHRSPGTGEFPAQMASYAENVSIWWRHHITGAIIRLSQCQWSNDEDYGSIGRKNQVKTDNITTAKHNITKAWGCFVGYSVHAYNMSLTAVMEIVYGHFESIFLSTQSVLAQGTSLQLTKVHSKYILSSIMHNNHTFCRNAFLSRYVVYHGSDVVIPLSDPNTKMFVVMPY